MLKRSSERSHRVSPRWAWGLVLIGGCIGRQGVDLPENIGQSHRPAEAGQTHATEDADQAEPVPVGTRVWANFRNTGFYFFGVVVEHRDERHRVIYADGSSEWLTADALLPDSLGLDGTVDVRPGFELEFAEGTVARRLGDAVYVRLGNGDERWTSLTHVRFQTRDDQTPERGDAAAEIAADGVAPGSNVLVNYREGGFLFSAIVTATGDDGRSHVVYLDGTTEWVAASLVNPDTLSVGDLVHVRRQWEPAQWVRGRVRVRHGHAFQVELDDGGLAWTALFRIRTPAPPTQASAPPEGLTVEPDDAVE